MNSIFLCCLIALSLVAVVVSQDRCSIFMMPCKEEECCASPGILRLPRCIPKGGQDKSCDPCGCMDGLSCENGRCTISTSMPTSSTDDSTVAPTTLPSESSLVRDSITSVASSCELAASFAETVVLIE